MNKKLSGVIPPLFTPLNEDGSLDVAGLEKLINHCLDAGVHGIFLLGSCGEGSFVTNEFRKQLLIESNRIINGRVPVLLGVLENTTSKVIEAIRYVEGEHVDYFVVVAPYYIPATQEMILKHVQSIVQATHKPLLIYNIPQFTNSVIAPETMAALCELPEVVGCKDTNGDWATIQRELFKSKRGDFAMLSGDEELCGVGMLLGTDGCVPGTGNIYPKFFVDLYYAAKEKNVEKVYDMMDRLDQFKEIMRTDDQWISRNKYLAFKKGLIKEYTAEPLGILSDASKAKLDEIFARVDHLME